MKKMVSVLVMVVVVLSFAAPASAACYDGFRGVTKAAQQSVRAPKKDGHVDDDESWYGTWTPVHIATPRRSQHFERI